VLALVTGASSGIGRDICKVLANKGYDIIAVARNKDRLNSLKEEIESKTERKVYVKEVDLTKREKVIKLHSDVKEEFKNIDILVNDAGFGLFGEFTETDLNKELDMIDTNITALHILTKLFLEDMVKVNKGHIMNVASIAGFMPGPLMATYYATKSYVVRLTESIRHELLKKHSKVKVSLLCPGPVNTNFNKTADVRFNLLEENSMMLARFAVNKMLCGEFYIFSNLFIFISVLFAKLLPSEIMASITYYMQRKSNK